MVNRMRSTRSHTGNRRSHHALDGARMSKCANCKELHQAHTVCMNCGWYNGRKVLDFAVKAAKQAKKVQAKKNA